MVKFYICIALLISISHNLNVWNTQHNKLLLQFSCTLLVLGFVLRERNAALICASFSSASLYAADIYLTHLLLTGKTGGRFRPAKSMLWSSGKGNPIQKRGDIRPHLSNICFRIGLMRSGGPQTHLLFLKMHEKWFLNVFLGQTSPGSPQGTYFFHWPHPKSSKIQSFWARMAGIEKEGSWIWHEVDMLWPFFGLCFIIKSIKHNPYEVTQQILAQLGP